MIGDLFNLVGTTSHATTIRNGRNVGKQSIDEQIALKLEQIKQVKASDTLTLAEKKQKLKELAKELKELQEQKNNQLIEKDEKASETPQKCFADEMSDIINIKNNSEEAS